MVTPKRNLVDLIDTDLLRILLIGISSELNFPLSLIVTDLNGKSVLSLMNNHKSIYSEYCLAIRSNQTGEAKCYQWSSYAIDNLLLRSTESMSITCWMGLRELMVPICIEGTPVGILVGGPILSKSDIDEVLARSIRDNVGKDITSQLQKSIQEGSTVSEGHVSFYLERLIAVARLVGNLAERLGQTTPLPSITEYIKQSRLLTVLILGKDSEPEISRLREIADILISLGYKPQLVKDHPDLEELSTEEKVRCFADASRFVLLENSHPAGQIAECKILSTNRMVTAFLREEGTGSSYMVTDYHKDFNFMAEFTFNASNDESLKCAVQAAISWAEAKITERREFFNITYPWRSKGRSM